MVMIVDSYLKKIIAFQQGAPKPPEEDAVQRERDTEAQNDAYRDAVLRGTSLSILETFTKPGGIFDLAIMMELLLETKIENNPFANKDVFDGLSLLYNDILAVVHRARTTDAHVKDDIIALFGDRDALRPEYEKPQGSRYTLADFFKGLNLASKQLPENNEGTAFPIWDAVQCLVQWSQAKEKLLHMSAKDISNSNHRGTKLVSLGTRKSQEHANNVIHWSSALSENLSSAFSKVVKHKLGNSYARLFPKAKDLAVLNTHLLNMRDMAGIEGKEVRGITPLVERVPDVSDLEANVMLWRFAKRAEPVGNVLHDFGHVTKRANYDIEKSDMAYRQGVEVAMLQFLASHVFSANFLFNANPEQLIVVDLLQDYNAVFITHVIIVYHIELSAPRLGSAATRWRIVSCRICRGTAFGSCTFTSV